jgi:PAS domain S-box-containing protein
VSHRSVLSTDPKPAREKELFEILVESSTDFAIYTVAPDGTATSWNIGAERVFGYSEEEIVGSSADVIYTPEDQAAGVPQAERVEAGRMGRAGDERWHQRKDGTRLWGSGSLVPLRNPGEGFVKIVRDRTGQHQAIEALREEEKRFRLLATSIPQLVFRTRPDGWRNWGSPQWIDFTGMSLEESLGHGWLGAIHPEDRQETQEHWQRALEKGEYYIEHRVRRAADGTYRWHQTRARPVLPEDLAASDWVGTMNDIHELRGMQERQEVLLAELQHRTRNLLAVVQSIASQTIRKAASLEEFRIEFEGRLRALGRVQGLLARLDHQDVDLHMLLEAELRAHGDGGLESGKISVDGPPVALPAISAQALGLALHELATNAVKYGALQQGAGHLAVRWSLGQAGAEPVVSLEWRESGVNLPMAGPPARKGYGCELIERALPYQLRARTSLEFGPDGVRCAITLPVSVDGADGRHG